MTRRLAPRRRTGAVLGLVLGVTSLFGAPVATAADGALVVGVPAVGEQIVMIDAVDGALATAEALLSSAGGDLLPGLDSIGVAAGVVDGVELAALAALAGVSRIEIDQPLVAHLDTSHQATRAADVVGKTAAPGGGTLDGAGVSVAIIDSGADGTHPFFQRDGVSKVRVNLNNLCVVGFTGDSCWQPASGNDSDTDSSGGHGTHVSGIAAGVPSTTGRGDRVVGGAPGADLVVLSTGAAAAVYASNVAFEWLVAHHADPCGNGSCPRVRVVNNSFGPVGGGDFDPDSTVTRLQRELVAAGVVVVWAAGNDGGDGSTDNVNPSSKDPTPGILSVANYDDADTGTPDGALAGSSSRGKSGSPLTNPDISAPGTRILSSCRIQLEGCQGSSAGDANYSIISGTSMAAPHVAGYVAVLSQAFPAATPAQIEQALLSSARKFGGAYETSSDPRAAGTGSTSFDRGHGLVDLAAALAALGGAPVPPSPTPTAPPVVSENVTRVSGSNRIATAAAASQATRASASVVVIARSDQYADALAGGPLAALNGGPLLLTGSSSLASTTRSEIQRLGASTAIMLGGEAALSAKVRSDLVGMGLTVRRIAGASRFETATLVADELGNVSSAFVVEGRNANPSRGWPDAVAAGAAAATDTVDADPRPVLLVTATSLPADTKSWLAANSVAVTIVGGTASVSSSVADEIRTVASSVTRVSGANRYATASAAARAAIARGADARTVVIATGADFPDALGAGPLVGARGGVLLLTLPTSLPGDTRAFLDSRTDLSKILIMGGTSAVSDAVLAELSAYVD